MRRWLLIFVILLLPLRGLVGEVMAGQMLQQHVAASAQAPAPAAAHDCDEHRHATTADPVEAATGAAGPSPDCPTCASCQVCSSVALSPFVVTPSAQRASLQPLPLAQRDPASAEPALAFKPPRG
jgi:hypothetical protein